MGDFSVWEFSGNPVYYCTYDYFAANDVTAIHVVLFSLEEPYETQLGHITYWLNLLKALTLPQDNIGEETPASVIRQSNILANEFFCIVSVHVYLQRINSPDFLSLAFGGRIQQPLVVVLVATHADLADVPRAFSGEFSYNKERVLLKEVRNRSGFKPLFCSCSSLLFFFLVVSWFKMSTSTVRFAVWYPTLSSVLTVEQETKCRTSVLRINSIKPLSLHKGRSSEPSILCFRFGNDLQVSDKLFVMDAGASNSKDLKLLRCHLQELRTNIISVSPANTQSVCLPLVFTP